MAECICHRDLNKRVTVERLRPSLTPDAAGHIDETNDANWSPVQKVWAQFITRGSREFFRGDQMASEITHQITIRYSKAAKEFTTKMRLRMSDGRKFNIAGPLQNRNEENRWFVFPAIEVPPQ